MATTRQELIWLKEDALNSAKSAHARIKTEQSIYRNIGAYKDPQRVGKVYSPAGESLYPKATEVINKIKPRIEEATPRVNFEPDKSDRTDEDILLVDALQNWYDMYEDADNEGDKIRAAIHHVCVGGLAIRGVRWDIIHDRLNAPVISPLNFAPDPDCSDISLSDAEYIIHTNVRRTRYIKRYYPEFKPKDDKGKFRKTKVRGEQHRVDEIWLRRQLAEEIGIDVGETKKQIIRAVLIDDQLIQTRLSPWIYPDFPFSCWRNFLEYDESGQPNSFWGFGFAQLLWPQQKFLDYLMANICLILKNQSTGRYIAPEGMFDLQNAWTGHGLEITYNKSDGFSMADIMFLPADQIPPVLFQLVEFIVQIMESLSGATPVFSGEAPFSGVSGRAVAALQAAALTQLSSLVRGQIEYRSRLARMKAVLIQQLAKRPVHPNLWRGGIDLPEKFPSDARHIGFTVSIPDASSLPQTPAGKLQIAQFLQANGAMMTLQKLLEFIGLDRGYGLRSEDFVTLNNPDITQTPINEEIASSMEVENGST